jgi:hypothetical protein
VPQRDVEQEEEGPLLEEEPSNQSIDGSVVKQVPELEDSPPPVINVVMHSPIRSGLRVKSDVSSICSLEESQGLSQEALEEADANQYPGTEETNMSHELGGDSVNEMESEVVVKNDQEEDEQMEVETSVLPTVQKAVPQEEFDVAEVKYNVEEMTVIDEVTGDGEQEEKTVAAEVLEVAQQSADGVSSGLYSCICTCSVHYTIACMFSHLRW